MKYFILMLAFAFTACSSSKEPSHLLTYEVTCPVTIQLAKVDTITGFGYKYYESSVMIYSAEFREYPKTCVVSRINDGRGN
jgi:hypothetical protein